MSLFATLNKTRAARYEPEPPEPTYLEVARRIKFPDGERRGEFWDPATEPSQIAMIMEFDDPYWEEIIDVAPSQRGKSLRSILLPMLRALCELSENYVYVMPSLDKLNQHWMSKLRPAIVAAGYGAWLPSKGPGSEGGRPSALAFTHPRTGKIGYLFFQAAGTGGKETALASNTARFMGYDESDDASSSAQLELAKKRTKAFRSSRVFFASTINERKERDGHPILALYEDSSKSRMWYACPFCAAYQPLEPDHLKFDDLEAKYICAHCKAAWEEKDRRKALRKWKLVHHGQTVDLSGKVSGDRPSKRTLGVRTWELDYLQADMNKVAEEWRSARKALDERQDHTNLRTFYNKTLVLEYDGDKTETGQDLTWSYLLHRAMSCKRLGPTRRASDRELGVRDGTYSHHFADPPPDANFCTGFIDVQHDRVYWTVLAMSLDTTTFDVAWGYDFARQDHAPWSPGELAMLLDKVSETARRAAGNLPFVQGGVDIGDQQDRIMPWLRGRAPAWVPCKGRGTGLKARPGDIDGLIWVEDSGIRWIHYDHSRDIVHAALRRPNDQPGAAVLPQGLSRHPSDTAYLRHLCAERMVTDPQTMKQKLEHGPGRWDWLDARRGAHVLALYHLKRMTNRPPPRAYGNVGSITIPVESKL